MQADVSGEVAKDGVLEIAITERCPTVMRGVRDSATWCRFQHHRACGSAPIVFVDVSP
jgi:hypothetical protein